jgi:hypothetical protein
VGRGDSVDFPPSHRSPPGKVLRALLGATLLSCLFTVAPAEAQKSRKALSKNEVIELLESGVAASRVGALAQQYGISFEVTAEAERQILDAGGDQELISALRRLASPAPRTPSTSQPASQPALLLIESSPGGAQVYIDDEPVGTTSQEGRLKLSRLAPGEHTVRLSLAGRQDHQESVELSPGQTVTVKASLETLQPNPLAAPSTPPPAPAQSTGAESSEEERGTLGVMIAPSGPGGAQGVHVTAVLPGGPADRAGLRVGHLILSIAGQSVASPQQVQQAMAGLRPGMTADITYSDGRAIHTTRAVLAGRNALPSPPGPSASSALGGVPVPVPAIPAAPVSTFSVAHDHGSGGADYCLGTMVIGNGMIQYRSLTGVHSFDIPLSAVKEAKKNAVYLVALGAFHIRLKKGTNYNFVVLNSSGQYQPPDALLETIEQARGTP